MCKSQAEGGQRCASHTRPAYTEAMTAYMNRATSKPADSAEQIDYLWDQTRELVRAATLYATTKKGIEEIEAEIKKLAKEEEEEGVDNLALIENLMFALGEGKKQRIVTKAVEAHLALVKFPEKSQAKIVRAHVSKLYDDINSPIIDLNSKLYSFGERKPITDLDAFHEEVDKQSKLAQEAVAAAYAKFAKATVKELKEHELSPAELKKIEEEDLYRTRPNMSRLDYYKARFAIEDKYNPDADGMQYVYGVYGVRYGGRNQSDEHILINLFNSLEEAVEDKSNKHYYEEVVIKRQIVK